MKLLDGCPAETTTLRYMNSEGEITGTVDIFWEESNIGVVTMRCPCGNLSAMLDISTRTCTGNFINQATWEDPIDSPCARLDFAICSISAVRSFNYHVCCCSITYIADKISHIPY